MFKLMIDTLGKTVNNYLIIIATDFVIIINDKLFENNNKIINNNQ